MKGPEYNVVFAFQINLWTAFYFTTFTPKCPYCNCQYFRLRKNSRQFDTKILNCEKKEEDGKEELRGLSLIYLMTYTVGNNQCNTGCQHQVGMRLKALHFKGICHHFKDSYTHSGYCVHFKIQPCHFPVLFHQSRKNPQRITYPRTFLFELLLKRCHERCKTLKCKHPEPWRMATLASKPRGK